MKNTLITMLLVTAAATAAQARPAGSMFRQAAPESVTNMQSTDGSDRFEVTIRNGKISAKHNGEAVPADRVKQITEGGNEKIQILDENGNVLKEFEVTATQNGLSATKRRIETGWAPAAVTRRGFRAGAEGAGEARAGEPMIAVAEDNHPPVMIGVTMSEPDEGVLKFLDLEKAVVFDRVLENLPAAKAGIKAGDILVAVKGEKNIDQEKFRELLHGMKAGDNLELKVASTGGKIRDVTIALAAFDANALGRLEVTGAESPKEWWRESNTDAHKAWDQARKHIDEAVSRLKEKGLDSDQARAKVEEALAQARKSLDEARESLREVTIFGNGSNPLSSNGMVRMFGPRSGGGQGSVFVAPAVPTPPSDEDSDERFERIEKKIEDLDEKLDRIMELLKNRK